MSDVKRRCVLVLQCTEADVDPDVVKVECVKVVCVKVEREGSVCQGR